jgi:hypothetical protein
LGGRGQFCSVQRGDKAYRKKTPGGERRTAVRPALVPPERALLLPKALRAGLLATNLSRSNAWPAAGCCRLLAFSGGLGSFIPGMCYMAHSGIPIHPAAGCLGLEAPAPSSEGGGGGGGGWHRHACGASMLFAPAPHTASLVLACHRRLFTQAAASGPLHAVIRSAALDLVVA